MKANISKTVKSVIAQECGINRRSISNRTPFMSNQKLPYFDCVGALFVLQNKFHVSLPEADYYKYKTVGNLIKNIIRQQHRLSK